MSESAARAGLSSRALRAIAFTTLMAAALRFYDLGGHPFWLDESATFLDIHSLFDRGPDAPVFVQGSNLLYYTLLAGWAQLFGESEAALRGLSALAGTLCVPAAARLARRLANDRAAIVCAVLVAVHPLHLHYSREARAYALWTLLLLVAIDALWRASTRGERRDWWIAGVAWGLAFGAHVFTLFALPASGAALLWSRDRAATRRQWFVFAAATGSAMLFYSALVLAPGIAEGTGAWLEGSFAPLTALPQTLWALLPAGAYPHYIHPLSLDSMRSLPWAPAWLAALAEWLPVAIAAFAIAALARPSLALRPTDAAHDWRPLAALALGPLLLQWATSFATPVYFVARYDLVAWPAFIVLISLAVARVGGANAESRRSGTLLAVLLVACALVPAIRALRYAGGERWHFERAHAISHAARKGDLVLTFSDDDDLLAHALARNGFDAEIRTFPGWLARQIAFLDTRRDLSAERTQDLARDAAVLGAQVEATLARGARVLWVDDSESLELRSPRAVLFERLEAQLAARGIERAPLDPAMRLSVLERRAER